MPCSRLGGTHIQSARLCFRFVSMDDLWVGVTATASPLAYQNIPTPLRCVPDERVFTLLMPNRPRLVHAAGLRYVQQPGECVLTDSSDPVVGTYHQPHAAICLNIPFDTVRAWLPPNERFDGLRLGNTSTAARVISMLLLSLWQSIDSGASQAENRRTADTLLELLARRCRRAAPARYRTESGARISCDQVKDYINAHIRNPRLSVQMVAERIGVTTRYLQLLFAEEGECASEYIKLERLRGCLLDLRDSSFDEQSITEIAFSWGFNSAAHFSSSFKKEYGLSPRDYRACDVEDLLTSPLAYVEGPLVQALVALSRSAGDVSRTFESRPHGIRPAAVYG